MMKRRNEIRHLMAAFLSVETHGPLLVMNGTPSYLATPSASVESFSAHCSNIFFFGVNTSTGSPSNPSNATFSPFGTPSGGTMKSTSVWSAFDAHMTIPSLSSSRSGPFLTLQSTSTRAPVICASVLNARKPLTICRGRSSPSSTLSTQSLSAPGCSHALTIVPTRMSSTETSIAFFVACGFASFFSFSFFSFFSFFASPPSAAPPPPPPPSPPRRSPLASPGPPWSSSRTRTRTRSPSLKAFEASRRRSARRGATRGAPAPPARARASRASPPCSGDPPRRRPRHRLARRRRRRPPPPRARPRRARTPPGRRTGGTKTPSNAAAGARYRARSRAGPTRATSTAALGPRLSRATAPRRAPRVSTPARARGESRACAR
mmetsp:Transcript_3959/g.13773  ORF Transcript_3959/g.13773 Transcript_3959/m.13773 type:complete len:377 (+) Transcript_3959:778-1908(+)